MDRCKGVARCWLIRCKLAYQPMTSHGLATYIIFSQCKYFIWLYTIICNVSIYLYFTSLETYTVTSTEASGKGASSFTSLRYFWTKSFALDFYLCHGYAKPTWGLVKNPKENHWYIEHSANYVCYAFCWVIFRAESTIYRRRLCMLC